MRSQGFGKRSKSVGMPRPKKTSSARYAGHGAGQVTRSSIAGGRRTTRPRPAPTRNSPAPVQPRRSLRAGRPADAPLVAPARGRARHPRLGHVAHRARAVGGVLGALQRAHHAGVLARLRTVRSRPRSNGRTTGVLPPARTGVRRGSTPRCAGRGRLLPRRRGLLCAATGRAARASA